MEKEAFEAIVVQAFEVLPERFKSTVENVGVVIEDYPSDEIVRNMQLRTKHDLLGLYQGIPLTKRGTWYGMSPIVPDKISLYQKNIEDAGRTEDGIRRKIHEVLIHEIGHYFGMNEEEIRSAGF
jgi:predicted Zn-dependent protease with MMP-like domain